MYTCCFGGVDFNVYLQVSSFVDGDAGSDHLDFSAGDVLSAEISEAHLSILFLGRVSASNDDGKENEDGERDT